ncbi:MAG: hypothetical protein HC927_01285 [Deltaproteobacteria bacterium]|nr:hypothetical protein [Deltaproteobacteria bacterium]
MQAVTLAWAQMTRFIRNGPEGQDYGNMRAVGVSEIRGGKKTMFDDIAHGCVMAVVAASNDA